MPARPDEPPLHVLEQRLAEHARAPEQLLGPDGQTLQKTLYVPYCILYTPWYVGVNQPSCGEMERGGLEALERGSRTRAQRRTSRAAVVKVLL